MDYITVFDSVNGGSTGAALTAMGVGLALVGVILLAVSRKASRLGKRGYQIVLGLIFLSLGIGASWSAYRDYYVTPKRGHAQVVEGVVSSFDPMPPQGHAMESFCVQVQCFHYSDYVLTPGFNHTSSHGGPIRLGLHVRVTHIGNVITKLEIAR